MNSFLNFNEKKPLRKLEESTGATILNIFGNFSALVYFATPLYQIIKKQMYLGYKIKNMPLFLILTIIFNCLFWLLQAFSSDDLGAWVPLLISNVIGLVMNTSLLFFYLYIYLNKDIKKFLGYGFFVVDLMIEITYIIFRYVIETNGSFHLIGLVATVINILMYSSPLQNLKKIIKERKYEALPIITLIVGLVTTLTFLLRGILMYLTAETDDEERSAIESMVSNGISFVLLTILASIYTYFFFNKASEIKKEDIEKDDVEKLINPRDSNVEEHDVKDDKKKEKKDKEKVDEDDDEEEKEKKKKEKKAKKEKEKNDKEENEEE